MVNFSDLFLKKYFVFFSLFMTRTGMTKNRNGTGRFLNTERNIPGNNRLKHGTVTMTKTRNKTNKKNIPKIATVHELNYNSAV